jgi:hypothetical protein
MAIVQISRITNRKGLTEDLPQLDGAEFGWCTDSRRLFIGNGTLAEGAPLVGNTEILTEFSDITVLSDYTYEDIAVGYAAQTGPTASTPIVRSVQAKLDDQASVRDFGAVGDGSADDTDAINRALFQLYCRETNTAIRRSLFFPAGTYRITSSLLIPTYAKLIGEGADCTIILLQTDDSSAGLNDYVARFTDSRQQTGANIGTNGATPPRNIEISSLSFQTSEITNVVLVEQARQCWFQSVFFTGPFSSVDITDPGFDPNTIDNIAAVRFDSGVPGPGATSAVNVCDHITFDRCRFQNITYGIRTDKQITGIAVTNSEFDTLYQGVVLSAAVTPPTIPYEAGPTGVRIVHNIFNNIYEEGIEFGTVNLNVSAYNVFYNVGDAILGSQPVSPVVSFGYDNNISVGDMFARTDSDVLLYYPRISITGTSTTTGSGIQLGRYYRDRGRTVQLVDNTTGGTVAQVNTLDTRAFDLTYTIIRADTFRHGVMTVVAGTSDDSTTISSYSEDYTENFNVGVTLGTSLSGDVISVTYDTTSTGTAATMTYSISNLA